jgi:hypothetical protein
VKENSGLAEVSRASGVLGPLSRIHFDCPAGHHLLNQLHYAFVSPPFLATMRFQRCMAEFFLRLILEIDGLKQICFAGIEDLDVASSQPLGEVVYIASSVQWLSKDSAILSDARARMWPIHETLSYQAPRR